MICFEYYRTADRQHYAVARREHKDSLNKHVSLMNGVSAHAPVMRVISEPKPSTELQTAWIAKDLPLGSSHTYAGPFGRSEKDVLDRLAKLEESGQAEADQASIGTSVYKQALEPPVTREVVVSSSDVPEPVEVTRESALTQMTTQVTSTVMSMWR